MTTGRGVVLAPAGSGQWLRLARRARLLSWLTLGWLGIEAAAGMAAAIIAGSAALLGFGLDSGIEALASIIVIWRFTGSRLTGPLSERRAQRLVAVSFWPLAPYIAVEGLQGLIASDRPETSWAGIALTAGTFLLEPWRGIANPRLGQQLGSAATAGEGTQNLLCAYLAGAVFIGLAANTAFGWWWLDGSVALLIAAWAIREGWATWHGPPAHAPAPSRSDPAKPGRPGWLLSVTGCSVVRRGPTRVRHGRPQSGPCLVDAGCWPLPAAGPQSPARGPAWSGDGQHGAAAAPAPAVRSRCQTPFCAQP